VLSGPSTLYLNEFYGYMIVFARFAGFLGFAPLFSEQRVNAHLRLLLTVTVTLVITPAVNHHLPPAPTSTVAFNLMLVGEAIIGIFAAFLAKILISALDTAGTIIGFQMGLANAFVASAATAQQTGLPSLLLTMLGTLFIFITDFHHVMIMLIVESYAVFEPGNFQTLTLLTADMSQTVLHFVSASFILALQLSAPLIILGLLMFLAGGVVNRLMPALQVFFVLQPLQILLGLIVLLMGMDTIIPFFMQNFAKLYQNFWMPT
jgi:Flagellar biosynthesis pathway, component FliR